MSTITKEFTQDIIRGHGYGVAPSAVEALARIALASLEAEPVADVVSWSSPNEERTCDIRLRRHDITAGPLYTAPPAPESVPDGVLKSLLPDAEKSEFWFEHDGKILFEGVKFNNPVFDACRAAMLQGGDTELQRKAASHDALCKKYNVESLADFVEWQRNHIAELEAAPPAPVGEGETAVMPDYPGYVMTQRECFEAGKKAGMAELVTTAYKLRDAVGIIRNSGIEIDAEKILAERDALDSPVIPVGWLMVPVEPTMEMLDEFDSIIDHGAEDSKEAWSRLIAAAPKQEVKP